MKKNHFFIPYHGNKRTETEIIYNEIKDKLDNIKIIIEPFAGTSAFSYYLSLKHPNKFEYILNDNNKYLMNLYDIFKNETKLNEFILKLNDLSKDMNKEKYNDIMKIDDIENWYYWHKVYNIRAGLYPLNKKIKTDFTDLKQTPIINFLRTENIKYFNDDAINIINKYKDNKEVIIFLDPPYLVSCNDFYQDSKTNIYEYLYFNQINKDKAIMLLCLEDNWIIRLLFKKYIKQEYNKKYEVSKKNTTHLIICNKK